MKNWVLWLIVVVLVITIVTVSMFFFYPNTTKEKTNKIPVGGMAPGAPEGDINESFLGIKATRGIRNNNPGNIKYSKNNDWKGKITWENNTDWVFEQFKSFPYGVRAMIINLRTYINRGENTVRKIIDKYDYSGNSDYINFVIKETGFSADQVLQPDKQTLKKLVQAMSTLETGKAIVTDSRFEAGWAIL